VGFTCQLLDLPGSVICTLIVFIHLFRNCFLSRPTETFHHPMHIFYSMDIWVVPHHTSVLLCEHCSGPADFRKKRQNVCSFGLAFDVYWPSGFLLLLTSVWLWYMLTRNSPTLLIMMVIMTLPLSTVTARWLPVTYQLYKLSMFEQEAYCDRWFGGRNGGNEN